MRRRSRLIDPYAAREARKYDRPIPSREFIMQFLAKRGLPLTCEQLTEAFGLEDERDQEALRRRLKAMQRDGQVIRNRRDEYLLVNTVDLVRGRVIGHPEGIGFLEPDEGGDDLFLAPYQMRSVLHGDRLVVQVVGMDRRGRREGAVVEILERGIREVVGRFHTERGISFVIPDNKRIHHDIFIPPGNEAGARSGQIVVAEILEYPTSQMQPIGRVLEVLGEHMAPGMEIDIAIRAYELPCEWPPEVEAEIASLREEVPESAIQERSDLRSLPLVTIDGADARDFDDAVYCEPTKSGFKLFVAIAHVSWYVRLGTALDSCARERGNSVYFPERVIPMLPERLSNGLCSLNPDEDRLCLACEIYINREGSVTRSRFYPAVMRSAARLTYDEVAEVLVDQKPALRRRYQALLPHLQNLYFLYKVLVAAREQRGALDLDTTETHIEFGPGRRIARIVPLTRNDAHRIIEECMIAANVAAARFLKRHKMPLLYRVHDRPDKEKLAQLRTFLGELGLQLGGGERPQTKHYLRLLNDILKRPDKHLIQTVLLRSLAQALYSPSNIGHFGLALDAYTHFTSPIRRYPDLLVHRAIDHVLQGGTADIFDYSRSDFVALGEHCSMTERRADEATRDAINWLKCEFMMDKVGQTFDGLISAVTSFGIFVELQEIYVEGLVHVTALGDDYFHFDPVGHRLRGERTRKSYHPGDKLKVKVVRVELDERKIDLELANHRSTSTRKGAARKGRSSLRARGRRKRP
jgi:ribonuclease R